MKNTCKGGEDPTLTSRTTMGLRKLGLGTFDNFFMILLMMNYEVVSTITVNSNFPEQTYLFERFCPIESKKHSAHEGIEPSHRYGVGFRIDGVHHIFHIFDRENIIKRRWVRRHLKQSHVPVFHPAKTVRCDANL